MQKLELQEKIRNSGVGTSQWMKGVMQYALEMAEFYDEWDLENCEKQCLNGAKDFVELSKDGNYLIYNEDIAQRMATPIEIKRRTKKDGSLSDMANPGESWLMVQKRALVQAYKLIEKCLK